MIDPNNPNQNQQNQQNAGDSSVPAAPQAQPQVQAQAQTSAPPPVEDQQVFSSVNAGVSSAKPELGPVVDTQFSENQDIEDEPTVEESGEFSEPKVTGEVKDMIKVKKDFPDIDHGAKSAGVTERIPSGPVYGNLPQDMQAAQLQYKQEKPASANSWRALEAIKNFSRNLLGQPKPSEV